MQLINLYNSLTRTKELLRGQHSPAIKIYVCGMTVYDYCHIGHARVLVFFDSFVRVLKLLGYEPYYVRNVTDIDDKIINKSKEMGLECQQITSRFIEAMLEDETSLGVSRPDVLPKATECIPQMIEMIQRLLEQKKAYQTPEGDVCYSVGSFDSYGSLANQKLDQLLQGHRVGVDTSKQHPLDFVLWKTSKEGEPCWDSPFGKGRPGWHIECSAMATHFLGDTIDIHGGGLDLKFPHHENEIAQAEGANNQTFVKHWMHVGHVQIDNEKMSKSLGNFITIRDILHQYEAETVRYFILSSHYRSPLSYSTSRLDQSRQALSRMYLSIKDVPDYPDAFESSFTQRFKKVLMDDVNVPGALVELFGLVKKINQHKLNQDMEAASKCVKELKTLAGVLGLLLSDPTSFLQGKLKVDEAYVQQQIDARNKARSERDYDKADQIRDELLAMGIELEDSVSGTTWRSVV
ncbi:MAG TPA: cysteine--tRNA ligase [Gammaproteobacteria bacterium]|nr:cysteine--tRNA ligase [Gammaproteobacteria bacterium]